MLKISCGSCLGLSHRHEILSQETRVFGAAYSEGFVILACTVLIGLHAECDKQTDGQTDRRTDDQAMAKTREALHAVACKNEKED